MFLVPSFCLTFRHFFLEFWHLNAQLSKIIKTLLISRLVVVSCMEKRNLKSHKNTEFHVFMVPKNISIKWNYWIFSYKFQISQTSTASLLTRRGRQCRVRGRCRDRLVARPSHYVQEPTIEKGVSETLLK